MIYFYSYVFVKSSHGRTLNGILLWRSCYCMNHAWNAFPTEWKQRMSAIWKHFCHQIFVILIAWNNNHVLGFGQFYSYSNCVIVSLTSSAFSTYMDPCVTYFPYKMYIFTHHIWWERTKGRERNICLITSRRYESMCSRFARMKRIMSKCNDYVPKNVGFIRSFCIGRHFIGTCKWKKKWHWWKVALLTK